VPIILGIGRETVRRGALSCPPSDTLNITCAHRCLGVGKRDKTMSKIIVSVELEEYQAIALAQFVKRVTYSTCETHSVPTDKEEPYSMLAGLDAVRRGLAKAGYAPR